MALTRSIAILDDGDGCASGCAELLSGFGCEVEVITCREDMVRLEKRGRTFDLAVIGERFLEQKGAPLWCAINQLGKNIPFIVITDGKDTEIIISATNNGAHRICKKPLDKDEFLLAVEETLNMITRREETIRLKTLLPLYDLSQKFFYATSVEEVCESMVSVVLQVVNVSVVSVLLYEKETDSLKMVAHHGLDERIAAKVQLRPGERIAGKVFESGSGVILNRDSEGEHHFLNLMTRKEISAAISFPLIGRKGIHGVLNVSETTDGTNFSEADMEQLAIIARQAMLALENIQFFNERAKHTRMVTLLGQYVSPEVSTLLSASGYDWMNTGAMLDLTVLFADIRHFTLLVQHLDSVELREFLNSFFDCFSSAVFANKGMLDKFMGDGALVVFGAPVQIDNPEDAAVLTACQIMSEFNKMLGYWRKKHDVFETVGLGIGISRGPMFLGNIGSSKRLDYTVIGTDVNIAQRLASETESGQIFITESCMKNITLSLDIIDTTMVPLRGIEKEVVVHTLGRCLANGKSA